jgi:cytochrome c553
MKNTLLHKRISSIYRFGTLPGIFLRLSLLISLSVFAPICAADERLVDAIKNGDLEAMNALIAEGVDVNTEFKPGWTPFRMAYLMKNTQMMQALIAGGFSLDGEWLLNETGCGKCHSRKQPGIADGKDGGVFVPHLAGQHSDYIAKQLRELISGDRDHVIEGFTLGQGYHEPSMHFEEIVDPIAEYVEGLARFDNSDVVKTENYDAGSQIYSSQCAGCHGENGIDTVNTLTPRLAGLYSVYTSNTLGLFRDKLRTNDPEKKCSNIAASLSEEEIQSVADYISAM